jgi:hypothetical protein
VALLGDSINHLVANAAECFAAQAGEEWSRDADGGAGGVTVLNAGFALPARLAALSRYNGARAARMRARMQRVRLRAHASARARKPCRMLSFPPSFATSPEEYGKPQGSWWDAPLVRRSAGTILVHKGWAKYNATQLAQLLAVVDVVILNYGHHYAGVPIAAYAADMEALMAQLSDWVAAAPPGRRGAFFRETGAQHFPGTGAFASWDQAHPKLGSTCVCGPLEGAAATSNANTAQNEAVRAAALRHPAVAVVPFYEITAPRYDMHEGPFCGFGNK